MLLAAAAVAVAWQFREQLPALAWPGVVAFVVWRLEGQLKALVGRVKKVQGHGWVVEMDPELERLQLEIRLASERALLPRLGEPTEATTDLEVDA